MAKRSPTKLVVVAGLPAEASATVTDALLTAQPGTVTLHHDLRRVSEGIVIRRMRSARQDQQVALELAHGCVSCTLREDVLPMLRRLADIPGVRRIVLRLDPAIEPDAVCWAIQQVLVGDRPVGADLDIEAVITVIDPATWLAAATDDKDLAEHGLAITPEDERTLAQVAVGQVEFADAIVLAGEFRHGWTGAKTTAVLNRLAPLAPRARLADLDLLALLARLPVNARRGAPDDPHGPVLLGQPPLDADSGCTTLLFHDQRPFHPQRLHAAFDALLDGVVRTRGRVWVASQPDAVLWLESAGGGLNLGRVGSWLAATDPAEWSAVDPQRQAMAALRWHPYYGDRAQDLSILLHDADPEEITSALRSALLTDAELAEGAESWPALPDPFGAWHTDPCADLRQDEPDAELSTGKEEE
ncbi:MAG TPA: GTP-binding protein [Pseudonocardiaceae bacterium]|jgi:G3E family GTPase|nr:GTP-binding protein [Pseudonocardiaceae bacterium]